jgi:hypothetical protein
MSAAQMRMPVILRCLPLGQSFRQKRARAGQFIAQLAEAVGNRQG